MCFMARPKSRNAAGKNYMMVRGANRAIPDSLLKLLIKQKYHIAGEHSAAKLCHWAGEVLRGGEGCYKNRFYGIASHRCLQCTPVLLFCNHACVFCWRVMPEKSLSFKDMPGKRFEWDEPGKIAEWLLAEQRKIVSGFGGNPKVRRRLYDEALKPMHAALSLTGEPAMYPHLERLIGEFHGRGMTTFLVTNGTFPERISKWKTFPTQFYVSMVAPNEGIYRTAIRPKSMGLWKKYLRTLELLPGIGKKTRTVLRMTIARGVNDSDLDGYAAQINIAQPHYVEVKSMVFVGGARMDGRGLHPGSMLEIDEIEAAAAKLAQKTGYVVSDHHVPSRVVLLSRNEKAEGARFIA